MESHSPASGSASDASLATALARFVAGLRLEEVPPAVVERAALCLLDFTGAVLAGAREMEARRIGELVRGLGGSPEASAWGFGYRAPAAWAALVNGAVGHHLELDDGHILGHVHPAATVIPAAFALAEARRASGRDFLAAVCAGYEVEIRVGRALAASAMYDRGFHGPGLFGAFGAVAAAARLLHLEVEQTVHALGNCCLTPAATFQAFKEGAGIKDLYCGWPAMTGLFAAQMAAAGIAGPRELLEGKLGLARAVTDRHDLPGLTADLGTRWLLPSTYIKRHSACSFAHTMIDALLDLTASEAIPLDAIRQVTVRTHRFAAALDDPAPRTLTGAKTSLPFCAALALARRRPLLADFTPEALADPDIRALAERTSMVADPELEARHAAREDRRPARVELLLADGTRRQAERDVARGWAEDPLSREETLEKFHALAAPAAGDAAARALAETILALPALPDLAPLARRLAAVPSP